MTREEKQKLSREKFLKGQEIHRQRELERQFFKSAVDARQEELRKLEENGINLSSEIYDELKSYGLNPKDVVCECIEDLVEDLYLERKAYDSTRKYFDLEDDHNSHYINTREYVEGLTVKEMLTLLDKAVQELDIDSRSELLYELANTMIIRHCDDDEKLLVYKKQTR